MKQIFAHGGGVTRKCQQNLTLMTLQVNGYGNTEKVI